MKKSNKFKRRDYNKSAFSQGNIKITETNKCKKFEVMNNEEFHKESIYLKYSNIVRKLIEGMN